MGVRNVSFISSFCIFSTYVRLYPWFHSYPGRFHDLELLFQKREYTQLSRLFGEVIDFVLSEHKHRVDDYLGYWAPLFGEMAGVVSTKGVCFLERFTRVFLDGCMGDGRLAIKS